jgi:L-alanine-DL-glutamate epimerase-like enolase superfamily enzyme
MTSRKLTVTPEKWPIAGEFTIARGSKSQAEVVVVTIGDGIHLGRGECVPYPRYGETIEGVIDAIEQIGPNIASGLARDELQEIMSAGAARNAIDCALWDLEAKIAGKSVAAMAGIAMPSVLKTAYTISMGEPEAMAAAAAKADGYTLLKLKLGTDCDEDRMRLVRQARPDARLIVDANEGWHGDHLGDLLASANRAGVELIEQPLPADGDEQLATVERVPPVCADESVHDRSDLARIDGRYDAINIKLDKAGGLTEALALSDGARAIGLKIMVGCMVSTSLAMAPAMLVAANADYVDLDGPLLLERDRSPGLRYAEDEVATANSELWG